MNTPQKDFLAKWAPLIFSVLANLVILGVAYGKNEAWKESIAEKVALVSRENLVSYLVTRREWEQANTAVLSQDAANREDHRTIIARLDRLIERMK